MKFESERGGVPMVHEKWQELKKGGRGVIYYVMLDSGLSTRVRVRRWQKGQSIQAGPMPRRWRAVTGAALGFMGCCSG